MFEKFPFTLSCHEKSSSSQNFPFMRKWEKWLTPSAYPSINGLCGFSE